MSMPANWYPDPDGGHGRIRWWDGAQWTEQTSTTATPGGWYADPSHPGQLRWWDGVRWSDYTAPGQMGQMGPGMPPVARRPYQPTRVLGAFALGTGLLVVLVQLALALSVGPSFGRVERAVSSGEDVGSLVTPYDIFGYLWSVTMLTAWLVNAAWLHSARGNAEALAPGFRHKRSSGWAWGAWVCPIVSLWFPYQVVRDVSDATRPRAPRGLLACWWTAFLTMSIFGGFVQLAYEAMLDDPDTDWGTLVSTMRVLEGISFVITALAAVAWLLVVRRIQADQEVAAALRAPAPVTV
jgi:hypothetical protein